MEFEELLEKVKGIDGEDSKEQIIAILEAWENPSSQKLKDAQETIKKQNDDIERYNIRIDELRKFNAQKFLNEPTGDDCNNDSDTDPVSLEDIIDSF